MTNPWTALPDNAPFVLPMDRSAVAAHNARRSENPKRQLETRLRPEPFVGRLDAPMVLLSKYPGIDDGDFAVAGNPDFARLHRRAITDRPLDVPFFWLAPELDGTPGHQWWASVTRELREEITNDVFIRDTVAVPHLAYHAKADPGMRDRLPSQAFGFSIVADAIREGRTVVSLYQPGSWLDDVPELNGYANWIGRGKSRRPYLTRRNMQPGDFERLVDAYG